VVGENRPAAPTLVAAEFETAIQRLSSSPKSGRIHDRRKQVHVRKVRMPRSRYHLYYEVELARWLVTILPVWHVSRGQGPAL
jgi:plasmid stabilization system protein ParE